MNVPSSASRSWAAVELELSPNEGSGLLTVGSPRLRRAGGWDRAFWVCFDEGPVEECLAVIGHRAAVVGEPPTRGWEVVRLHARQAGPEPVKTEDCEALAAHQGWVYVIGSHFGSKSGPLQRKRGFIARFTEAEAAEPGATGTEGGAPVRLEVRRTAFALQRLLNDALVGSGLLPLEPDVREAFITATRQRGAARGKEWADEIRAEDYPVNLEGTAFLPDGTLLLGLRFPVSAEGRPLLVALSGVAELFAGPAEAPGPLAVTGCWELDVRGTQGALAGIRDMTVVGDTLHVVTGGLDATGKGSVLLTAYPHGHDDGCAHWACPLPTPEGPRLLAARSVRAFPDQPRVEGIAAEEDGHFCYVSDEDDAVHVCHTVFLLDA
jgi:hypothetical protein